MDPYYHVTIHPAPKILPPPRAVRLLDIEVSGIAIGSPDLPATMEVSFEDAERALAELPRLYIEPDGAFSWCQPDNPIRWRLEGTLYDGGHRLVYVDLKGTGYCDQFDRFLNCLGSSSEAFVFQLPQFGVFLDKDELQRYVRQSANNG